MGGEISQSAKGGQGTQQNQNQQPKQFGSTSASRQFVAPQCHDPVRKRKAESVTDGVTGTDDAPKRHKSDTPFFFPNPAFYGADDSVVIEVEKTEFRLHQSTLQKKSAYFAALFARSGGWAYLDDETDEQSRPVYWVRGPVHRVAETTADDFATLLIVIEEPIASPHPSVKLRSLTVPFALHLIDVLY
jgi:hypothetical protein